MKIFIPCKLYIFGPAMYRHGEVKYVKEQLSLSKEYVTGRVHNATWGPEAGITSNMQLKS